MTGCTVFTPTASPPPAPPNESAGPTISMVPSTLTYAVIGLTWTSAPDLIIQEKGFLAEENLTVDQALAGQSAASCQQVLARAAQIGGCSISDMIQAVEAGNAPLIIFMRAFAQPPNYSIMARPDIKSWTDLKGKTIMVGGPRDNTVFFTRAMARPNGLQDNDFDFQFAGASSARYAALKSGAVDAAILTDPFDYNAGQEGYTNLDMLTPKYVNADNYGYASTVVHKDWARENGDVLVRFIRAYIKATRWMNDPANQDALFTMLGPKLNLDRPSFDRVYKKNVLDAKLWSAEDPVTDAGTQGVENSLVELGALTQPTPPPSKYYDMAWWQQAKASLTP
jgi:ABC-type nitrate/sulfonate/bicarbonate transport system substrate-binding protein